MSPYRTPGLVLAEPELTDSQVYELGRKAVQRLNRQCPNALVIEAKSISIIEYDKKVRYYHHGDMVMKHSIRHMISFPRHWREPCCKEPILDLLEAECLSGWYGWRWRRFRKKNLQIQMFQGVVTREDFQKLLVELRGLDELGKNYSYQMRRRRVRLYERARRYLQRLRGRGGSSRRPSQARLGP